MIPENVTLIVKAPNQQIEDQNIECLSSWTVKQLKGHLSEVYPNKPGAEEQKIIYSGQLLEDTSLLRDVLRAYDSQVTHTMHLVCAPRRTEPLRKTTEPEGLRRRTVDPTPPEAAPAEMNQNHQNHTVEMQNYLNSMNYGRVPPYPGQVGQVPQYTGQAGPVPPYPGQVGSVPQYPGQPGHVGVMTQEALANQVLMMQQAYMQYMQQYALWQAAALAEPPAAAAAAPEPAAAPAPAAAEEEARDWLDHLYAGSRLAILSSLVYLYGSGARLLLVLVLSVAGYLHQIGFFRDLNLNPNALRNRNQPDNQQNPAANQPDAAGNQPTPAGNQPNPETEQQDDNHRSLWAVTWMIFTTFFASLIPDANHQ